MSPNVLSFATCAAVQVAIPITVRQLEAIIRLSEALARMELSDVANANHVKEAIRLFTVSTFQVCYRMPCYLVFHLDLEQPY